DRFIPNRDDSDIQAAFELMSNEPVTPKKHKRKISAADMDAQKEEANETFTTLLSSELFGSDSNAFAAAINVRKAIDGSSHSNTPSPFATASRSSSGRQSLRNGGSQPTTPTKRNIFHYGSKSPTSSISRARDTPGRSGKRSESRSPSRRNSITSNPSGALFGGPSPNRRLDTLDSPSHDLYSSSPVSIESQRVLQSPRKTYRSVSKVPYKVLDAPDLADDFYLNLVDWSSKNVLGVGLSNCVYLWSAKTSNVTKLCEVDRERDRITSVNWCGRGDYLAVGLNSGSVQIWDPERVQLLRTFTGHSARVGSLAWNESILSTGSRDRTIFHRDVRVRNQSIRELKGHAQEICGLKWNTATNQLASGGNDNKLFVWDGLNTVPLYRFGHHRAAVKAIAWSPHESGLLASGGGTADMHIRFFKTTTGTLLSEVDTGSQVCNLAWSKVNNEIVSTHGFSGSKVSNQVQVWRYPDMGQVATLMGHTMRVLYLAMSPDGESVVSGAGDETLRFWDLNSS
ncbi:WD40 repeat-like protein, partial [Meira miltonrushii]